MSTNDIIIPTTCANCGKGEEESLSLKNCVACKMVKYCGRDCQKAHRSQHKKECRLRAAELHDEALFRQPPRNEDCPICFMQMPTLTTSHEYNACCGKIICCGCIHAGAMVGHDELCPFCRTPAATSDEENVKRVMKRVEMGDAQAMHGLGCDCADGTYGMPQDGNKALELWLRAGELGHAGAYCSIGNFYLIGVGVERDEKKATHYYELAAIWGNKRARYNLGVSEWKKGNMNRSLKHFMIAAGGGYHGSLKMIQQMCKDGQATRDDYAKALTAYQAYLEEIKSDDRDKAAAFDDEYKYYE